MMVIFLSGEIPRDDLSHVEMQMEVRNKLYWSYSIHLHYYQPYQHKNK